MTRGRPAIYPWDTWLDGQEHRLRSDQDWGEDVDVAILRGQVLREARDRGLEIETKIVRQTRAGAQGVDWLRIRPRTAPVKRKPNGSTDWAGIFGAGDITLVEGRDFEVPALSMQSMALQAARRRKLTVRTTRDGKKLRIKTELAAPAPTIETQPATEMASETKE